MIAFVFVFIVSPRFRALEQDQTHLLTRGLTLLTSLL